MIRLYFLCSISQPGLSHAIKTLEDEYGVPLFQKEGRNVSLSRYGKELMQDVEEILAVPLIGVVPDDEQIVVCTNKGETVIGADCTSGQAFANISRRIMGEDVAFMELSGKKGFWSRLFKKS